jgi:leucyl aminopeptidase
MEIKISSMMEHNWQGIVAFIYEDAKPTLNGLDGQLLDQLAELVIEPSFKGKEGQYIAAPIKLEKSSIRWIALVGLGKKDKIKANKLVKVGAIAAKNMQGLHLTNVGFMFPYNDYTVQMATRLVEGAIFGSNRDDRYRSEPNNDPTLTNIGILAPPKWDSKSSQNYFHKAQLAAEAALYARKLSTDPGNIANPAKMVEMAQEIAKNSSYKLKILDADEMKKLGMGSLLGVGQGSANPPKMIVFEYGDVKNKPPIVFVGKGITFDTGGICIKPAEGMETMKGDKSGAVAVLALFTVLQKYGINHPIVGIAPCVENMPDGNAYRPGDILKASNGKFIEVINTDAEGRLILADALVYAQQYKPEAIIDMATLTGACVVALGNDIAGVMGNNEDIIRDLIAAGDEVGEPLWHLPLPDEYNELLKSSCADFTNTGGRWGGALTAGLFLQNFVGDYPWVHIDIAGPAFTSKDSALGPKGATGFIVRTLLAYLDGLK